MLLLYRAIAKLSPISMRLLRPTLRLRSSKYTRCSAQRERARNDSSRRELIIYMSTKRVILANGSRLLREMLHRVINKAENLEVVQEIPTHEELPLAIKRFYPEWVIISSSYNDSAQGWVNDYMADYPSVRFIFFSPENSSVKMKWQSTYEEDLTNLSLRDFIHILEKDLQHT